MIYFDHNATTPLLPQARDAWLAANEKYTGNPSSLHRFGSRAEAALNEAREQLATFLHCDALDIVWTSGATESSNTVLHHISRADPRREAWLSASEHPCLLEAAQFYLPKRHRLIPATSEGVIDLGWLKTALKKTKPSLIAVMAANNETGIIQPWSAVQKICEQNGVLFFCDAAQWIGKMPAAGLGRCDFVSGCAHKFGGPRGVGFLKCPKRGRLHPLLHGGKQEEGRRAGTENLAGVLAMLTALQVREAALAAGERRTLEVYRTGFEKRLLKELPGIVILGQKQERLWNTVSAIMPDTDCRQRWVVKLDKAGFAVSTGSACASGQEKASHVLAAMGIPSEQAVRVLRFSSGWETTAEDWSKLNQGLLDVANQL